LEELIQKQKKAMKETDTRLEEAIREKDQWIAAWEELSEQFQQSRKTSVTVHCDNCETEEHSTAECPNADETF
jgi:hypothetical protein